MKLRAVFTSSIFLESGTKAGGGSEIDMWPTHIEYKDLQANTAILTL
jgi:hypothetical protein